MNDKNIDMIQGQQIEVIDLILSIDGFEAILTLEFLFKDNVIRIVFHNVSNINIKDFSRPFQICGFQILDNKNKGWDKPLRYTVHDFEEGKIQFYCEYFEFN